MQPADSSRERSQAVTVWLLIKGRSFWFTIAPAIAMAITTYVTLILSIRSYLAPAGSRRSILENKGPLMFAACLMLVLATGILIVAVRKFGKRTCDDSGSPGPQSPIDVEGI